MAAFYLKLDALANRFTRVKYWKLYLAILCTFYCIVTNVPQYKSLIHGQARGEPVWNRINRQIDNPFKADTSNDPESHEARLTFRLTAPLIGKLLPTGNLLERMTGLFIIQNLCGLFFFYLLMVFAEANFTNRLFSVLLPICFTTLYAGKTFFSDLIFFFDGFAYLFLLITITTRKPLLVFTGLLLAFFTDERAIIGSGFVMLYHVLKVQSGRPHRSAVKTIPAAIVFCLLARFFLQWQFGMTTPASDINLKNTTTYVQWGFVMLGIFTTFKSFWVIYGLGFFYLKGFWPKAIFFGTLIAVVAGGISVFDFSRSISYGFVGLLAILFWLYNDDRRVKQLNQLLLVLFFTSVINPAYDVHRHEVFLDRSVPGVYFEKGLKKMPGEK